MQYVIRVQNIAQEEKENLKEKMSQLLASWAVKSKEEFANEIEQIYRVNSAYSGKMAYQGRFVSDLPQKTWKTQFFKRQMTMFWKNMEKKYEF